VSVLSKLTVKIDSDTLGFRKGLGGIVNSLRKFDSTIGPIDTVAKKLENMQAAGRGKSFKDPLSGQFIGQEKAIIIVNDALEALDHSVLTLRADLEENIGAINRQSKSLVVMADAGRRATISTTSLARWNSFLNPQMAAVATTSQRQSMYLKDIARSATDAGAGLNYFGLVNYDVRKQVEDWNWLSVIRGPGRLVEAYDRLRQRIFGIVPPLRTVQKVILDLIVPGLLAVKEALDESGASARTFTGILAGNLGKAAEDIKNLGQAYKRTLFTDIRAGFQIAAGSVRSWAISTKEDVNSTLVTLKKVPAIAKATANSFREIGAIGGVISEGLGKAGSAVTSFAGNAAKVITVRTALASVVGIATAAALSLGSFAVSSGAATTAASAGISILTVLGTTLGAIGVGGVAATAAFAGLGVTTLGIIPTITGLIALFGGWSAVTKTFRGVVAATTNMLGKFVGAAVRLPITIAKFTGSVIAATGRILTLGAAFRKTATDAERADASLRKVNSTVATGRGLFTGFAFAMSSLGPGIGIIASMGPTAAVSFGAVATAINGVKEAANFEQVNIAFEVMLKNADLARRTVASLQQFADVTPFDTDETIAAGKALLAFGFAADQLIPNLTRIGDIASGVKVDFGELANLFGQFRAQSKIMTQDLRQLTSRGIPILEELARGFGVPTAAIFEMAEKGQIGFEHIDAAFKRMTASGGQFAGLMARQSRTVGGLWSTLASNVTIAVRDIGIAITEGLNVRGGLDNLITVAQFVQSTIVPAIAGGLASIVNFITPIVQSLSNIATATFHGAQALGVWIGQIVLANTWLKPFAISLAGVIALMKIGPIVTMGFAKALAFLGAAIAFVVSPVGIAVIGLSALFALIGSSFGLFDNFGQTVQTAFMMAEYAISNFGLVWEVAYSSVLYTIVSLGNEIGHWFTKVIPAYLAWFGRNWTGVFQDLLDGTVAVMMNLWTNVTNGIQAVWDYITSAGRKGSFVWQPLLTGFESVVEELPAIADRQMGALEKSLQVQSETAANRLVNGFDNFVRQREQEKAQIGQIGAIDAALPDIMPKIPDWAKGNNIKPPVIPNLPKPPLIERPKLEPFPDPRAERDRKNVNRRSAESEPRDLEALVIGGSETAKAFAKLAGKSDSNNRTDQQIRKQQHKETIREQRDSGRAVRELNDQIKRGINITNLKRATIG